MDYCTVDDITTLVRPLTAAEQERAKALIPIVCDSLRMEADKEGMDLDARIASKPFMQNVAKSVVVDVVMRALNTSADAEPVSQTSESAMGYSVSSTFLVPGGGLFIKKSELARLGIGVQMFRSIDMF